jgi:hypothetical protein
MAEGGEPGGRREGEQEEPRRREGKREEGEPRLHYSREDRLSLPSARSLQPRRRGGPFRGNRSLMIILLDVLLILFLGIVVVRFLNNQTSRANIAGYAISLRAVQSGEVVEAALSVRGPAEGSAAPAAGQSIQVHFSLSSSAGQGPSESLSSALPAPGGEPLLLRQAIPGSGEPKTLYADVQVGQMRRRLAAPVERP